MGSYKIKVYRMNLRESSKYSPMITFERESRKDANAYSYRDAAEVLMALATNTSHYSWLLLPAQYLWKYSEMRGNAPTTNRLVVKDDKYSYVIEIKCND